MSKIQRIHICNFKSIQEMDIDFKGMTCIVTAGNNKGKTSFLRGIPDRIRFIRPEVMVKQGSTKGKGEMTLDTGEKFVWEFTSDGSDILKYVTADGKAKVNVTKELGSRFFPPLFDIDKFLQSTPQQQTKQLQTILGIDFTTIDARYKSAFEDRTYLNKKDAEEKGKLIALGTVENVAPVDLTDLQTKKEQERERLNALYQNNKNANNATRTTWLRECEALRNSDKEHNDTDNIRAVISEKASRALDTLFECGYEGNEAALFVADLKKAVVGPKQSPMPAEPAYIAELPDDTELKDIDAQIFSASETNRKADLYKNFVAQKETAEKAYLAAIEADNAVKAIEAERKAMIETAKLPAGISITPDGITIDGLPLDRNQISTSKLYCAALRIASMNLGEVKTLYFDASFLDRNSLTEIEAWASENDLQLLIERPDFDGGDIKYEIIENAPVGEPATTLFNA